MWNLLLFAAFIFSMIVYVDGCHGGKDVTCVKCFSKIEHKKVNSWQMSIGQIRLLNDYFVFLFSN